MSSTPRMAARAGSSAGLNLCMVVRLGNSEGSRAWQGLSGRPSDWGPQTPANGCPHRIPDRCGDDLFVGVQVEVL